jgi:hypothetical protein
VLLACATPCQALDPAYLAEWPTAERVLADHQGKDHPDTLARQMAALHHLDRAIEDMAGPRRWRGLTPDENRIRGKYGAAAGRIRDEVNATFSNQLPPGLQRLFARPPLREWYSLQWRYERDPEVRTATLGRYLAPPLLQQLAAQIAASDARIGKSPQSHGLDDGDRERIGMLVMVVVLLAGVTFIVRFLRRPRPAADATTQALEQKLRDPAVAAATDEVMDSLEPYLAATLAGRARIPFSHITNPFVLGFMVEYCEAALDVIEGTDGTTRARAALGMTGLVYCPRFLKIFSGASVDESLTGDGVAELPPPTGNARIEALKASMRPTVTRLHPAGSHAQAGHRTLLMMLTLKLLELADKLA